MLIDQNLIAIGVVYYEIGGACGIVSFNFELYSLLFEFFLKLSNIGERIQGIRVIVPAGIECENVLVEHTLKQSNYATAIFHYQPVLILITASYFESQLLIECSGYSNVLNRQAY